MPNRVLANEIAKTSERDTRLPYLVKSGLLEAGYNLNAKLNMIILPMEMAVAAALGLPRHLIGGEVGPNEKKEYRSHSDYSGRVAVRVGAAMDDFADILTSNPPQEHDKKPSELSRAKLEKVSSDVYALLIAVGPAFEGKPLKDVPL